MTNPIAHLLHTDGKWREGECLRLPRNVNPLYDVQEALSLTPYDTYYASDIIPALVAEIKRYQKRDQEKDVLLESVLAGLKELGKTPEERAEEARILFARAAAEMIRLSPPGSLA